MAAGSNPVAPTIIPKEAYRAFFDISVKNLMNVLNYMICLSCIMEGRVKDLSAYRLKKSAKEFVELVEKYLNSFLD